MEYTRLIITLCLCLQMSGVMAQQLTDTIYIFFELDNGIDFNKGSLDANMEELKNAESIRVLGFTDHLGSVAHNQSLSEQRAFSVANQLQAQGIRKQQLTEVKGHGEMEYSGVLDIGGVPEHRMVMVIYRYTENGAHTPAPPLPLPLDDKEEVVETFDVDTLNKSNIVLHGLSFIGGRHFPTPESMPELDKLVQTMKKYPNMEIEIQGHICCEFKRFDGLDIDTQELTLSKNRAHYVYKYLLQHGISATRMSYVGKGSSDPKVFPELSEEDRQANRRVEIKILKVQ